MPLDTGQLVPTDFNLALSGGLRASMADYRGRWLVLYFYPRDATPGCTAEGLDFNMRLAEFQRLGAEILGVSRDSLPSHDRFCARQGFGFRLISDRDEVLCNAFGVLREKQLYGRSYLGIERSTFLIDPDGRIRQSWRGVKVPGHAEEVVTALKDIVVP